MFVVVFFMALFFTKKGWLEPEQAGANRSEREPLVPLKRILSWLSFV